MTNFRTRPIPSLQRDPQRLTARRFDALIIGGGINGAGTARDLAMRGLRVALVEKGDFASGTSSASTKLIHGGLRYLENYDFKLVFESCRERRILQKIAPHLVRPLPFFIPVYRDDPRPLWMVRGGLTLYDLLALFRNTHPHRALGREKAVSQEPALRSEGLSGVAQYWDCRTDDARLCLENVLAAAESGAVTLNYMEARALKSLPDGWKVGLIDRETGEELEAEARVVVNAAGPWLDRVCALAEPVRAEKKLRLTRGTHVLLPRINRGNEALYLTAGRDDRLFFVLPWGDLSLVGTTDVDFTGSPDEVRPVSEDIDYLLEESARHLRDIHFERSDVVASFAGLRPLLAAEGVRASKASREHSIFSDAPGLLSIGGGKYTTYRAVAEELAAEVAERVRRGRRPSLTHRIPLPGGATGNFDSFLHRNVLALSGEYGLPPATLEYLLGQYGSRTRSLLSLLDHEPDLIHPVADGSALLKVQVAYAVDCELARTPEDVLRRRTSLALNRGRGLKELEGVAGLMAERLGAPPECRQDWIETYHRRYDSPFGEE